MSTTYGEVWARVARTVPDRTAIISGDLELTYAEFDDAASRFATVLTDRGIGFGSPVAIVAYNRAEYMIALFATFKIGAILVPINFRYGGREIAELVQDCGAAALIYVASLESAVAEAVAEVDRALVLVRIDDDPDGSPQLESVRFDEWRDTPPLPDGPPPDDGELYLFTGGTTGRPKAVVWPVHVLFEIQLYPIYTSVGLDIPESIEGMVDLARDLGEEAPVVLPLAPFMHGTALFNSMNGFVLGGTLVILPTARFDGAAAVRTILDRSVTRLIVAGDSVAIPLLEAAEELGVEELPSVRTAVSSGMRFSDAVKARIHALGTISIADIVGATEGGPFTIAVSNSADDLPARMQLMPGAIVLDEAQEEIQDSPGEVGLLAYRGTLPRGYLDDPERTAATYPVIRGVRHLVPGDYVRVEPDHHVELLGRGSAVINTGGEKVYPAEVEEALLDDPRVTDAVVFGVPDPRWGEAVSAAVAVPAADVDEEELIAHVGDRIAGYKKPKRILVLPSIERSPSGKVDMARLRAEVLTGDD